MNKIVSNYSLSKTDAAFLEGPEQALRPFRNADPEHTMVIDPGKTYQSVLGFGSIWTETDTYNFLRMNPENQAKGLKALFDPKDGAGWDYMRIPFGSTDWDIAPHFYSYDDVPYGEEDWELKNFSIQKDIDRGVFDIARRALEINPNIVYFGSVWCIPAWMKESGTIMYSRFRPECVDVYAKYLTKTVLAYKEQGIDLYAVTPQNESLIANDRATPATLMPWWVQQKVAIAMRREFDAAGLDTRVWIFDHSMNMNDYYVLPFLADEEARKAIDGVAYHNYEGHPFVLRKTQAMYPEVNLYMTERTLLTAPQLDDLVCQLRSGARSYAHWSTMSDEYGGPHVFRGNPYVYGGRGTVPRPEARQNFLYNKKEDPDDLKISIGYGLFGIFPKYVKQGMVRVDSTYGCPEWLTGVAFKDEKTGEGVMVVVNQTNEEQPLTILLADQEASFTQPAMSVAAYRFDFPEGPYKGVGEVNADKQDYKIGPKPGEWDIDILDIKLNGPAKGGADLPLSVVVQNAGDTPTPEGATLYTEFKLDGDIMIGISHVPMPVLQPGDRFEAAVTVPLGMPYYYRVKWHAESGHHQIYAFCTVGNAYVEGWQHNNYFGKDFDFE